MKKTKQNCSTCRYLALFYDPKLKKERYLCGYCMIHKDEDGYGLNGRYIREPVDLKGGGYCGAYVPDDVDSDEYLSDLLDNMQESFAPIAQRYDYDKDHPNNTYLEKHKKLYKSFSEKFLEFIYTVRDEIILSKK